MCRWLAVALLAAPPAAAADPVGELLPLVPPDAAVVGVARDLRTHADRLLRSPFARWLGDSKLLDRLAKPDDVQKLQDAGRFLTDKLGATPRQVLDDLLGDAVVLSYRPGKPGDESGVVLVHARDPARLEAVVGRVNALQTDSGELSAVTARTHAGASYSERTRTDGGKDFVLRAGPLLAVSAQEAAVRTVIDRRAAPPKEVSPAAASVRRLGLADAAAVVWFRPAAFAEELHAKQAAADPTERAVLRRTAEVWAACDGLAAFARLDRSLQLGAAVSVDPAKLPAAVRPVLLPAAGPSAWGAVPADALLAVGGRTDLPTLIAAAESFLPADGKAAVAAALAETVGPLVGRPNLPKVLTGIGPEWVAWADAPTEGVLPGWTVAVKLAADVRKPVVQALDFGVGLMRLGYNREHADQLDLGEDTRDGRTVKFLVNATWPAGLRPAYGVGDGFLVVASSPDRVHRFRAGTPPADAPLVRLDAVRLRAYLVKHRDALAAGADRPAEEVKRELDGLADVLRAVKGVELRHAAGDGVVRLTLDVQMVESLR